MSTIKHSQISALLVDDDAKLCGLLRDYLEGFGFSLDVAEDASSGLEKAVANEYDVILLDMMLPDMDGFKVIEYIDKEETAVIFLTALQDVMDKVKGLKLGAEDYIVKPFGVKEVCARVRAVLRRTENQVAPQQEEKIKGGDITVDIVSHTVTKGDKSIELTAKEFDLLVMLMRNSGRVLTRDTLLDRVWGVEYFGDTRTVDVHVRYLRQKIEDNPDTPQLLQTVRGVGYKFVGE